MAGKGIFSVGRVVRLKSGGMLFTISERGPETTDEQDVMLCVVGAGHHGLSVLKAPSRCFNLLPPNLEPVYGCGVPGDMEDMSQ